MTYPETIKYLESFINYEKISVWPYKESLRLKRFKDFLATINNPQDALKCIHVAGSKGKGSTCAFITYILRQAGYKIGLYTSPHLSDFRERIRILSSQCSSVHSSRREDFEGMILKYELTHLVEKLKPAIENYNKKSKYGPLSFFEVYTALALIYFKEKKVGFAVLETGLGGRLDATNVVNPLVCVITPISYEHTQKLGNTLREIAKEKAGIIKKQKVKDKRQKAIVITAPQEKEVIEVIGRRCKKTNAKLYQINRDILYKKTDKGFKVRGLFGEYSDLNIRLKGAHQLINAAVAIATVEALRFCNVRVGIDSIRQGVYNTVWPGRAEIISRKPLVVLDGAQNIASIQVLKKTIKEEFKYKRLILVLGISNDKDIKGICRRIYPLADEVILTQANNPRASKADFIEQIIRNQKPEYRNQIIKTKDVKEAKRKALLIAKKEDLVLVCGSLFVVGEFRCMI